MQRVTWWLISGVLFFAVRADQAGRELPRPFTHIPLLASLLYLALAVSPPAALAMLLGLVASELPVRSRGWKLLGMVLPPVLCVLFWTPELWPWAWGWGLWSALWLGHIWGSADGLSAAYLSLFYPQYAALPWALLMGIGLWSASQLVLSSHQEQPGLLRPSAKMLAVYGQPGLGGLLLGFLFFGAWQAFCAWR